MSGNTARVVTAMGLVVAMVSPRCVAAELTPTSAATLVGRATPAVDGELSDWDLTGQGIRIDPGRAGEDPAISLHANDPGNPITGEADLGATAMVCWDDANLYIAGVVTDDDLRGIRPASAHNVGPPGWGCDSLMFRIHSFRQPLRTNSPYSPTPFMALRYEAREGGRGVLIANDRSVLDKADAYWKLPEGSLFASRETDTGYQVEAAVPWAALGFRPQAGETLFCAFLVADIDEGEKLNQLGWRFADEPRENAVFRLVGRPGLTGMLSLSKRRPEAGARWSVSYQVDARVPGVAVKDLVLRDGEGVRLTVPVGVAVPAGQTASDVVVVEAMPGGAAACRVELTATVGGQEAVVCAEELEIVAAAAPGPMVVNPAGELHHQRPDRVAHSAYEDHRRGLIRHGFVTGRSGYEEYIRTHVRSFIDRQMQPSIDGKSRYIAEHVLMSATLHMLTGEEPYAELTRQGIGLALALQEAKLDFHALFPLVSVRYHVWQNEPDTDLAPADAEGRFQRIWARVMAEHDPGWMFGEWGYHNRCWHRFYMLKIGEHFARQLGTAVPDPVREYIAFHEPILERFGAATDNSSGYHWVGFRYPVYWGQATNTLESLAGHKGWVEALQRWRRYSAPSGAVPNFGDTSGWCSGVGPSMANYELMGRVTRDGRFRWQAHRIAEYLYNHFWPRHDQYHGPREFVASAFCAAWLYADDTVQPVPVEDGSAVTFRTRVVATTEEERKQRPGLSKQKLIEDPVPDKLVLSSGRDPQRLWGLVELLDLGGHCGRLPGNIAALTLHDTALLAGQGYYERACDFNNILWIEDMDGIAADPRPMRAEVPVFVDDPAVTYARVRVRRFQQMPVTVVRDIVFVKNAFVLVKDRATFHATMRVRVGPCWQTRDLGPQCGEDWFNTYYEWIYFTGLGLGRGVHAYRNPAWDLLVRFAPRVETQVTVVDRYKDNPYRPSPTQLRQSWTGIVTPGDVKTFTTILLPHGPALDVVPYAEWARFVVYGDDVSLVHVTTEVDNMHEFRDNHWVLLQEQSALRSTEEFVSDARFALVTIDRNGSVRPGVMWEGGALAINGQDVAAQARRAQVRSVYELEE